MACGWLGEAVALALRARHHAVLGTTTTPAKAARLRGDGVAMRILRLEDGPLDPNPDVFDVDVVVLAVPPTPFDDYPAVVGGVAGAVDRMGSARLVFTSSTSVYGLRPARERAVAAVESDAPIGMVPEPGHADELGPRGRRMRAAEAAVRGAMPEALILRLGGLHGPGRPPGRFLAGRRDVSRPDAPVNLVHRDDVVRVVGAVIEHGSSADVFNVVAPGHPSRESFYTAAARREGREPPTFEAPPAGGSPGIRVSSHRVVTATGVAFAHPTQVPGSGGSGT